MLFKYGLFTKMSSNYISIFNSKIKLKYERKVFCNFCTNEERILCEYLKLGFFLNSWGSDFLEGWYYFNFSNVLFVLKIFMKVFFIKSEFDSLLNQLTRPIPPSFHRDSVDDLVSGSRHLSDSPATSSF